MVSIFSGLGYRLNENLTEATRASSLRQAWLHLPRGLDSLNRSNFTVTHWLGRSLLVFDRIQPLTARGCTRTHPLDSSRVQITDYNLPPGIMREAVHNEACVRPLFFAQHLDNERAKHGLTLHEKNAASKACNLSREGRFTNRALVGVLAQVLARSANTS